MKLYVSDFVIIYMLDTILSAYKNSAISLYYNLSHFSYHNYIVVLLVVSILVYFLELAFPWRKEQNKIRKDFYLDAFYMFFNLFIFSVLIFAALSDTADYLMKQIFGYNWRSNMAIVNVKNLNPGIQILILFLSRDFIQWFIHRLLHRFNFLWEFHKVHHSVEVMGFAAHLRYHPFENIFYRSIEVLFIALFAFSVTDFFIVYVVSLCIGHLNHANFYIKLGPLKYIFNNSNMHMWHHVKISPYKYGINFGMSLSIWDYLFKTAYLPSSGKNIDLGFSNVEKFPDNFLQQSSYPFRRAK